jgi:hypothetical protein
MAVNVRILDLRIAARFREPKPSDVIVASIRSLSWIIDQVLAQLGNDRIERMSIACHGYEAGIADQRAMISRMAGGFGLQLGQDDLTFTTVGAFQRLNGKFTDSGMLDIYACAAAEDASQGNDFTGNGRALMQELAGWTNATVRASDSVQQYSAGVRSALGGLITWYEGADFGDWEGKVWLFAPDGRVTQDASPGRGVR